MGHCSTENFREKEVMSFELVPLPGDSEVFTYYVISLIVIGVVLVLMLAGLVGYFFWYKENESKNTREIEIDGEIRKQKRRKVKRIRGHPRHSESDVGSDIEMNNLESNF